MVNVRDYEGAVRVMQDTARPFSELHRQQTEIPVECLHQVLAENSDADPADDFIVYPIVPKRGAVLLFGVPKELKSWMGAALALDVAAGSQKALGFFRTPRAARTLYVQVEDTRAMTRSRLEVLNAKQIQRSRWISLPFTVRRTTSGNHHPESRTASSFEGAGAAARWATRIPKGVQPEVGTGRNQPCGYPPADGTHVAKNDCAL